MTHVVVLPYFSHAEVARYLKILRHMAAFPKPQSRYQFLLAASPRTEPDPVLHRACAALAPTTSFQCPTRIFGYPQGPTAMFWDCMDLIDREFDDDGGFSLWLESDMAPVKPDWLDRLASQWDDGCERTSQTPLMMGCYVPKVYKQRLLRGKKLLLEDHVNGGACYAKHFAKQMPAEAKQGVFDVMVYRHARRAGRVKHTQLIDFSNPARARRDVMHPDKVLLHGFMQPKDAFIEECLRPLTEEERQHVAWHVLQDRWENVQRRLRVWFVRRGQQAMYENMLLAKDNRSRRAA